MGGCGGCAGSQAGVPRPPDLLAQSTQHWQQHKPKRFLLPPASPVLAVPQLPARPAQLTPSQRHVLPRIISAHSPISADGCAAAYRFLVSCSISKRQMWFKLTAGVLEPDMAVMDQPCQGTGTPREHGWDAGDDAPAPHGCLAEPPLHPVKLPPSSPRFFLLLLL